MEIYYLILLGPLVGIITSFFGIGGGVVMIPLLYTLFPQISPVVAIISSLSVIFLNSFINSVIFLRMGLRPVWRVVFSVWGGAIVGIFLGSYIVQSLDALWIKKLFGVVLIISAIQNILKRSLIGQEVQIDKSIFKAIAVGFSGGLLAGLTGLGGGIVMVPLFLVLLKIDYKSVSRYSNLAMLVISLAGIIFNFAGTYANHEQLVVSEGLRSMQFGPFNLAIILVIFIGSLTTGWLGALLSQKVSPEISKSLFVGLMLIMAIKILCFA